MNSDHLRLLYRQNLKEVFVVNQLHPLQYSHLENPMDEGAW